MGQKVIRGFLETGQRTKDANRTKIIFIQVREQVIRTGDRGLSVISQVLQRQWPGEDKREDTFQTILDPDVEKTHLKIEIKCIVFFYMVVQATYRGSYDQ